MKKNELIKFKKLINNEIDRRKRINELLEHELVREYLKLTNIEKDNLSSENIKEILNLILKDFKVVSTNKIYVCTQAYYTDCRICYQDTNWYTKNVSIDSKCAENKIYKDIESGLSIETTNNKDDILKRPLIDTFEKENIVLNPYNTHLNENGYEDVRLDFFENTFKYGQVKSKKMILKKYPII